MKKTVYGLHVNESTVWCVKITEVQCVLQMKRFLSLYTLLPVMRSIALGNQSKITKSLQFEIRNVIVIFITLFVWVDVSMRVCVWEWMCLCVSVCVSVHVSVRQCVSALIAIEFFYWYHQRVTTDSRVNVFMLNVKVIVVVRVSNITAIFIISDTHIDSAAEVSDTSASRVTTI